MGKNEIIRSIVVETLSRNSSLDDFKLAMEEIDEMLLDEESPINKAESQSLPLLI